MVDIAMCKREDCSQKGTCFRYLAFPSEYQTYMILEGPIPEPCTHYWRCRNPKELRELNLLNDGSADGYI